MAIAIENATVMKATIAATSVNSDPIDAPFGGLAGFPLSHTLARDFVAVRFGRDPRFLAVDRLVRERGTRIVVLARLCLPWFPSPSRTTEGRDRTPMEWALLGLGLVATVALTVYLRSHVAGMLATSEDGAESQER